VRGDRIPRSGRPCLPAELASLAFRIPVELSIGGGGMPEREHQMRAPKPFARALPARSAPAPFDLIRLRQLGAKCRPINGPPLSNSAAAARSRSCLELAKLVSKPW